MGISEELDAVMRLHSSSTCDEGHLSAPQTPAQLEAEPEASPSTVTPDRHEGMAYIPARGSRSNANTGPGFFMQAEWSANPPPRPDFPLGSPMSVLASSDLSGARAPTNRADRRNVFLEGDGDYHVWTHRTRGTAPTFAMTVASAPTTAADSQSSDPTPRSSWFGASPMHGNTSFAFCEV